MFPLLESGLLEGPQGKGGQPDTRTPMPTENGEAAVVILELQLSLVNCGEMDSGDR